VIKELAPIRERRAGYEKNPEVVEDILATGNQSAQQKATETMAEVRETVGL
jgi:tryptophanyl-tRNA synthetase